MKFIERTWSWWNWSELLKFNSMRIQTADGSFPVFQPALWPGLSEPAAGHCNTSFQPLEAVWQIRAEEGPSVAFTRAPQDSRECVCVCQCLLNFALMLNLIGLKGGGGRGRSGEAEQKPPRVICWAAGGAKMKRQLLASSSPQPRQPEPHPH